MLPNENRRRRLTRAHPAKTSTSGLRNSRRNGSVGWEVIVCQRYLGTFPTRAEARREAEEYQKKHNQEQITSQPKRYHRLRREEI
jgi:hypothetical protein